MQFSRIIFFLAAFVTFGAFVLATPAPAGAQIERRTGGSGGDKTDAIEEILLTLRSVTEEILPELESVIGQKNATFGVIEPLLQEIAQALDNAHISLLVFGFSSLGNNVNATAIAFEVTDIIQEIISVVEELDSSLSGLLASLMSSVDVSLCSLLSQLNTLVPTILSIISPLLQSVYGITFGTFSNLSFFLVAGLFV